MLIFYHDTVILFQTDFYFNRCQTDCREQENLKSLNTIIGIKTELPLQGCDSQHRSSRI